MIEATEREHLLRIYAETRTIAVVGASAVESKAAHRIPRYLQAQGYRSVQLNPRGDRFFLECVFPSLREIDVPVDVPRLFALDEETLSVSRRA